MSTQLIQTLGGQLSDALVEFEMQVTPAARKIVEDIHLMYGDFIVTRIIDAAISRAIDTLEERKGDAEA